MSPHMSGQTRRLVESLFTNGAEMRSLISVLFPMQNDRISIGEFAITFLALELLALAVNSYVLFQIRIGGEGLVAVIATKWPNFIVNLFKDTFQ